MRRNGEDSLVLGMVEEALAGARQAGKAEEATNIKMLLGQLHALQVGARRTGAGHEGGSEDLPTGTASLSE